MLLIAPALSYRIYSYIQAANRLAYPIQVVSNSRHSLVSAVAGGITVDFAQPDLALQTVLDAIAGQKILTVIATDDAVVELASRVAQQLGLPQNSPQSAILTCRKDLARQRLRQHGCNVPHFEVLPLDSIDSTAAGLNYPVVIKPLMLSGSRGVIRCDHPDALQAAATILVNILSQEKGETFETSNCLVEAYLTGIEIAFDGFVRDGQLIPLAFFDKPEAMTGPYFEESYYVTPSRLETSQQQQVIDEIARCCQAYGLTHGPVHAEARITSRGVYLLEMASRTIGGQCGQMIEYILDQPLEEIIIRLSCGEDWSPQPRDTVAGVLMIPIPARGILKRVEGLTQAQKVAHVRSVEIYIQPGYELVPLPEGSSYLGFIFAQSPDYADTLQALKDAHACLKFITGERWQLLPANS